MCAIPCNGRPAVSQSRHELS